MSLASEDVDEQVFSVDTSSFIHAWRRDYPPDVFPGVWETLANFAAAGLVVSPDEVLIELERGGDEIFDWAKDHREMFLTPDASVQSEVERIVNRWTEFVPNISHDGVWADPYVIALAVVLSGTVVTGETLAGANARAPKIPNICDDLAVPWTTILGLLRSQGLQF